MMLNAQRAREQVLALVMASHNRCGASSPARHLVRALPDLATSPLWDWCLGPDSEVVFGLLVSTPEFHSSHCYYTFGVSSTLMSVTRDIGSVGGRSLWKGKQTAPSHLTLAVDPGHLVVTQFTGYGRTGWAFSLLDVVTQEHRLLLSERVTQSSPRVYANRKWFLRYQIEGSLVIVNLQQQQQPQHVEISDILRCDKVFRGEVITFLGISISNYVPDEAVLLYNVGFARDLFLLLVDVSNTHSTGNLSVLSLTKVLLDRCPDTCYGISSCLLMKKANGARVFMCPFLGARSYTVFEVAERVGTVKLVSSNNIEGLSQLSTSLFCTLKADYHNIEIWDCNNIATCSDRDGQATPLRVISLSPVEPDTLLFVEGASGSNRNVSIFIVETTCYVVPLIFFAHEEMNMLHGQHAREQILALVMASHNRCGASSPARHFVSLQQPPGATSTSPLWDWCLGPDSEVVFGLLLSGPGFDSSHCYYTFGVSSALMSVPAVTRRQQEPVEGAPKRTEPTHAARRS
ncbi:hypothetical protein Pelo_17894 [Pelomyxa schiedti]|nr:hypothetical protein Pelo_17894 [Pelomyxa schiedti]